LDELGEGVIGTVSLDEHLAQGAKQAIDLTQSSQLAVVEEKEWGDDSGNGSLHKCVPSTRGVEKSETGGGGGGKTVGGAVQQRPAKTNKKRKKKHAE